MSEQIYLYQMSGSGTYENPFRETLEQVYERKSYSTMEELIKGLNGWGGQYFIGTQAEYDNLNKLTIYYTLHNSIIYFRGLDYLKDGKVNFDSSQYFTEDRWKEINANNYFYYQIDGSANYVIWKWIDYLKGNQNGEAPKFTDLVSDKNAKEITKTEYETLSKLNSKIWRFKSISSPKLAAYILKCEDYVAMHVDSVGADALKSFIDKNGKIDVNSLEKTIAANQNKKDSIIVLAQVYLKWISAIESGTQADLDTLPDLTADELNRTIDAIWKAEHDKERTEAIKIFHSTENAFRIVDKYNKIVLDDEIE